MGIANPHGGKLVNRSTNINQDNLFSIQVSTDLASDIENISDGVFSPLEGFLLREDFEKVVTKGRLANDLPWTIPIVLDVDKETATKMKDTKDVALNVNGTNFAVLHVEEIYAFDKNATARGVYGTTDEKHPGVAKTMSIQLLDLLL